MPCLACKGAEPARDNCRRCGGDGYEKLTRCPYEEVPQEFRDMIDLCDYAEKGMPPVLAGYHQQCAAFTQSLGVVRAERAYFKSQLLKRNDDSE